MSSIRVVGLDPAFSNFGSVTADLIIPTLELKNLKLALLKTTKMSGKSVRVSSDDLRRAKEIHSFLGKVCSGASLIFSEIPSGSQSAVASKGLGIALGILSSCPLPIIEVTAMEVKKASVGKKTATKQEMIDWAYNKYPSANWKTVKRKGEVKLTNDNEHLADAIAVIHAGINTSQFKQAFSVINSIGGVKK